MVSSPITLYASASRAASSAAGNRELLLGLLNSAVVGHLLDAMSPTLDYRITALSRVPLPANWKEMDLSGIRRLEELARSDWNDYETSWDFTGSPWIIPEDREPTRVSDHWDQVMAARETRTAEVRALEDENNRAFLQAFGLLGQLDATVPEERVALGANARWRYPDVQDRSAARKLVLADAARELCSYAVGCMFGRYSLDKPGLILASQGDALQDYLAKVPQPVLHAGRGQRDPDRRR